MMSTNLKEKAEWQNMAVQKWKEPGYYLAELINLRDTLPPNFLLCELKIVFIVTVELVFSTTCSRKQLISYKQALLSLPFPYRNVSLHQLDYEITDREGPVLL